MAMSILYIQSMALTAEVSFTTQWVSSCRVISVFIDTTSTSLCTKPYLSDSSFKFKDKVFFNTPTITRQHTARDCSCLLANLTFQSLQVIQKSNILAQRHIYQAHQHCESNNNYISNKFFHTELMNPAALPPCQNSTDTISDNPDTPTIITTSPQYRLPPVMVQQYSPLLPVALM